ncbi:MAG: Rossman fold protein, TIGR00730 family [Planctomycetes bacterium RIFCSPHIGHO2_02_FULL_40_12]|nr:MAG: Rossman fold protein, TIGR00730 family [Planctomycetes bacterium RIFCSPHIGHO2_02_FULL_40_12]OHC02988.1 MAG: Rossman fold protein, TIGR00730 family [Planctomycetes bacterium RIFCSPLOWO2_12_FULL_40_19]
MPKIKRLCVYCGSSSGRQPDYSIAAGQLARAMVRKNIDLVYGGASIGIMGEIADAVLKEGGNVIGIIPKDLFVKEVVHTGLTELREVASMHERKLLMAELSDGFVALPGGFGTFEEILEIITWSQLGMHQKPCGLLNVRRYYDRLIDFLDHAVSERFIKKIHRSIVLIEECPDALLAKFETYKAPEAVKWIDQKSA